MSEEWGSNQRQSKWSDLAKETVHVVSDGPLLDILVKKNIEMIYLADLIMVGF